MHPALRSSDSPWPVDGVVSPVGTLLDWRGRTLGLSRYAGADAVADWLVVKQAASSAGQQRLRGVGYRDLSVTQVTPARGRWERTVGHASAC